MYLLSFPLHVHHPQCPVVTGPTATIALLQKLLFVSLELLVLFIVPQRLSWKKWRMIPFHYGHVIAQLSHLSALQDSPGNHSSTLPSM